jgi:hypothetical protein
MSRDIRAIEKMMEELGCTGDKISQKHILERIASVEYSTIELCGQKFMYCGIKMDNGFVVVGNPSVCIDPSNWRDEIGKNISFDNSFDEIFKLEAYRRMTEKMERS